LQSEFQALQAEVKSARSELVAELDQLRSLRDESLESTESLPELLDGTALALSLDALIKLALRTHQAQQQRLQQELLSVKKQASSLDDRLASVAETQQQDQQTVAERLEKAAGVIEAHKATVLQQHRVIETLKSKLDKTREKAREAVLIKQTELDALSTERAAWLERERSLTEHISQLEAQLHSDGSRLSEEMQQLQRQCGYCISNFVLADFLASLEL